MARMKRLAVLVLVWWGVLALSGEPGSAVPAAGVVGVRVEGTVLEVSAIPDPVASPYKECLFTLKVAPRRGGEDLPPVLLVLQAFVDRELTAHAGLSAGDRIGVVAVPFAGMPEAFRSQRIADAIEDLGLEMWAGVEVEVLRAFAGVGEEGVAEVSPVVGQGGPLVPAVPSSAERSARAAVMREDLVRIRTLVDAHGGWEAWHRACGRYREDLAAQAAAAPGEYLVRGRRILIDPAAALSYAFHDDDAHYRNVLEGMETLARQFRLAGTDLIVAPIPMRDELYAVLFVEDPPPDGELQPYRLKFFHDLLVRDIEAVDLMPAFRDALARGAVLYHDNTVDGHVSGEGARLAGEVIARRLGRYAFAREPVPYVESPLTYVYAGELLLHRPEQTYLAYRVREPDWGSVAHGAADAEVLLIGDSMVTAPPRVFGADLGLHVMRAAEVPITFYKHAGSAPTMARFLAREGSPAFFSHRKACVFVFAFDYIRRSEDRWAIAPFVERWLEGEGGVGSGEK
jgi:hypothetical protein